MTLDTKEMFLIIKLSNHVLNGYPFLIIWEEKISISLHTVFPSHMTFVHVRFEHSLFGGQGGPLPPLFTTVGCIQIRVQT